MARNPKYVRRHFKRVQAQIRRGTYKYPPPTYDQLNPMKPAFVTYAATKVWVNVRLAMQKASRSLTVQMTGLAQQLRGAFGQRSHHYQDDYRLVE